MTTETKHTSGPWYAYLEHDWWQIDVDYVARGRIGEIAPRIAELRAFTDENKANAYLIAAAPELLEALQQAVRALNIQPNFKVGDTNSYAIASLCDRSIAKALGSDQTPSDFRQRPVPEPESDKEIAIYWHIDDVKSIRPDLNDVQAFEVLEQVKGKHDATVGINWEVLEIYADELFPKS